MHLRFKPNKIKHRAKSTDTGLPHLLHDFEQESTLHLIRLSLETVITDFNLGFPNGNVSMVYCGDGATIDGDRCEEREGVTLAEEAFRLTGKT